MPYFKTPVVASQLNVPDHRLHYLLRGNKIAPPQKDSSGDYVWTPEDVERARHALAARRPRQGVEA